MIDLRRVLAVVCVLAVLVLSARAACAQCPCSQGGPCACSPAGCRCLDCPYHTSGRVTVIRSPGSVVTITYPDAVSRPVRPTYSVQTPSVPLTFYQSRRSCPGGRCR